jgi:hypothetical protein
MGAERGATERKRRDMMVDKAQQHKLMARVESLFDHHDGTTPLPSSIH